MCKVVFKEKNMKSFETKIRVRYKDTDQMGVVHHSNYVTFYETSRCEMLREIGLTYRQIEQKGIMLPVKEVAMNFIAPAYYDDLLTVSSKLLSFEGVRITFDHEVRNQEGLLLNTGRVILVFTSAETRRPCRAPKWFMEFFE